MQLNHEGENEDRIMSLIFKKILPEKRSKRERRKNSQGIEMENFNRKYENSNNLQEFFFFFKRKGITLVKHYQTLGCMHNW
jgi:hypothetical protein